MEGAGGTVHRSAKWDMTEQLAIFLSFSMSGFLKFFPAKPAGWALQCLQVFMFNILVWTTNKSMKTSFSL